ncbi:MAG: MBL fold metallo-hydrolase [Phycisphaerales bacterium]|nr:MBL fold metallo-hydrolase [Phycisphaerales bacterium]
MPIHDIDLEYLGMQGTASSFLLETDDGPILVESGPMSTLENLVEGIRSRGVDPDDIRHVLLTHIHLDHAGAAGWFAERNAMIHVHPIGAPHLVDPRRLNASAERIYGDRLSGLLGHMHACPEHHVHTVNDGDEVAIGEFIFTAMDTPGHARHHHSWGVELDGRQVCFTGDIAGMRIPGTHAVTIPLAPPELDPTLWHQSIDRIEAGNFDMLMLTHSGRVDMIGKHLATLRASLDEEIELLTSLVENEGLDAEARIAKYLEAIHARAIERGAPREDA